MWNIVGLIKVEMMTLKSHHIFSGLRPQQRQENRGKKFSRLFHKNNNYHASKPEIISSSGNALFQLFIH